MSYSYLASFFRLTPARRRRILEFLSMLILKPYVSYKWPSSEYSGKDINVVIYFADSPSNIYQIREWYGPLTHLSKELNIAILTRSPRTFLLIRSETTIPVVFQADFNGYEAFFASNKPELILYVNHNKHNLASMQWRNSLTVFICHGESEKPYMTWGQIRAYDFFLVAGQASIDRLRRSLPNYDTSKRAIIIGRPQCDIFHQSKHIEQPVATALYCPTRESDRASMALSSVLPIGISIVSILLSQGIRVIYRPHPCLGKDSWAYHQQNQRIKKLIKKHNATLPHNVPPSIIDTGSDIGWQIAESTFCISDISAFGIDYLACAKPLILTMPATMSTQLHRNTFLEAAYVLSFDKINTLPELVSEVLHKDPLYDYRRKWAAYYFDGLFEGPSTPRFVDAVRHLVCLQRSEIDRLEDIHRKWQAQADASC